MMVLASMKLNQLTNAPMYSVMHAQMDGQRYLQRRVNAVQVVKPLVKIIKQIPQIQAIIRKQLWILRTNHLSLTLLGPALL